MGFASVFGKAQTLSGNISDKMLETQRGVEKSAVGVGEWFGNLGEGASSLKWLLYIVVFVILFVAIMSSIGYSGVGGPAAVGKGFGNLGEGVSSMKWLLYIVVFVILFVAVMSSIGYSGVGGPAARIAEHEYGKRR
jgi:uncharacterized membrane protein